MRAVDLHKFSKAVNFFTAQALAAGHLHSLDQGGRRKELEAGTVHNGGHVHQLQPEAGVGLVHAVAAHGFVPGQAREGPGNLQAHDLAEHAFHQALGHGHDLFFIHKAHLHVHLGELRLAVGAQIFITKAAHDLKIALQTGHHEQLFENLRRLGQGVEFAGIQPAGHQKVPRPFGRGLGEHRGFHLRKAVLVQKPPHALGHPVAQTQVGLHARSAQIQIAPGQTQIFARIATVLNGERRRFGGIEQLPFVDDHLDLTRNQVGVDHALWAGPHPALDGQHVFRAQNVRIGVSRRGHVRAEDHLSKTLAVTQVYKNQPAVVAPVLHPAHKADFRPIVGNGQLPAVLRAPPVAQVGNVFTVLLLHILLLAVLRRRVHLLSHCFRLPPAKSPQVRPGPRSAAGRSPDV